MSHDPVVAVPANIELDERLLGPVTFRMAGWLSLSALGAALIAARPGSPELAVPSAVLLVLGGCGAFWRPGGRPAPGWLGPLWAYRRRTARPLSWRAAAAAGLLALLAVGAVVVGRWSASRAAPAPAAGPSAQPTETSTGGNGCGC